jgi:hypothetical protein
VAAVGNSIPILAQEETIATSGSDFLIAAEVIDAKETRPASRIDKPPKTLQIQRLNYKF